MAKVKRHKKVTRAKRSVKKSFHPKNLYQEKYFYILGVALLITLFVVGVKILFANASYIGAGNGGPANPGTGGTTTTTTSNTTKAGPVDPLTIACGQAIAGKLPNSVSSINKLLWDNFKIKVDGFYASESNIQIFTTMCMLRNYPKFMSLLHVGREIDVHILSKICSYHAGDSLNQPNLNMHWCPGDVLGNRFTFVHELGHFIRARNDTNGTGGAIFSDFAVHVYGDPSGQNYDSYASSYYAGTYNKKYYHQARPNRLVTENCWYAGLGTTAHWSESECFSDMIGEFLVYNQYMYRVNGRTKDVVAKFKSQYANGIWYAFAAKNIFGVGGGGGILAAPVDQSKSCSAYMQGTACNSGPDKGTTNAIITKCTQYGSTSYSCYNPNKAKVSWYTQMNSCSSAPFAGNGTTYTAKGHKFLIRKENGVTSCVADCTVNSKIVHCN